MQAVVSHEAGVRKPPMHEPAGRGRCYGDLKNLLFRRGWRDGRCGWRGDPDAPADGSVGRRNRSTGVPSTCGDGTGRSDLTVARQQQLAHPLSGYRDSGSIFRALSNLNESAPHVSERVNQGERPQGGFPRDQGGWHHRPRAGRYGTARRRFHSALDVVVRAISLISVAIVLKAAKSI